MIEIKYHLIPSYWQSREDGTCYMTDNAILLHLLRNEPIQDIQLLIAYFEDRNYAITYASSQRESSLPFNPLTVNDLLVWQDEQNLVISEFDFTLKNNTSLKTTFGGDVLAYHLPNLIFDKIKIEMDYQFQDNFLYQSTNGKSWQNMHVSHHSIENLLMENEEVFIQSE